MFRTILKALHVVASVLFIVSLVLWIAAALLAPRPNGSSRSLDFWAMVR